MNRYTNLFNFNNVLLLRVKNGNILKNRATTLFLVIISVAFSTAYGQAPVANFTGSPTAGCSPLVVNFQDLSSNNPTSWLWDFGNGSTSTVQNPTATYFTPGTYTVKLTATNASGSNTLTRTAYINVYAAPTANFTADDSVGCFPHSVQFTDLSTAGTGNVNVSWLWNFGDGATSTQQNPTHTYTATGNYTVTLRVTNDKGCFKIFSKPNYIQVGNGVVPNFTNTTPTVCRPPVSIDFTNTSTGPGVLSYSWNFGDGGTSTQQNPSHVYNNPGSYTVSLTVTSSLGCSATKVVSNAVVIDTIVTSFSSPDSVCVNALTAFTNTSSPAPVSAFWDFGDGTTSAALNPVKSFNATGVYTVKLINTYTACSDSTTKTITVLARPVADFTTPDSVKCQPPHTVNFQDLSTNAVSWQWDFGDGASSTQQNPIHTYTNYGSFTVTLVVSNSFGCTDTLVKNNFIRIARPVISFTGLPVAGCVPYTINPVANITALDTVTSYLWNFGDGNTSTLQNPSHTYNLQGTYTVSLVITTSSGCTDTLTLLNAVRVGTKPTADFSASPLTVCAITQPVSFTDLSTPATVNQWFWDFGDGATSSLQNPNHAYGTPGSFDVTLIATNNGCPDTIVKTSYVSVLPPVSQFVSSPNCSDRLEFTFTDNSIGPISSWQWDFGDGSPVSNLQNPPPHTFPGLGVYNVTLTVTNGGCTHSSTQTIRVIDENPDFTADQTTVCRRSPVQFTATNISTGNITLYYWDFGDGSTTGVPGVNVSHSYQNSGNYTVSLVITDLNGCTDTIIKNLFIRVNGPVANFDATNTDGCSGLTTTFNDLSTTDGLNNIVSWKWDFGDGSVQTFTAPPFQHTYNTAGTYSVKLTITDAAGCIDSVSISNLIHATDPVVNFSGNPVQNCPNSPVYFTSTSSGLNLTYSWDFGDGTGAAIQNPFHGYSATGTYSVKLVVTDQYGCSDSLIRSNYVTVDFPVADFSMDDSISSCIPFEVNFTNNSSYYYAQWWDFGDGVTSTLQNPSHYFTAPGTYTVKLRIQSPGSCQDSITKIVTIYDTAGTRIDYTPFAGCKPLSVDFSAVTNGPATYIWDFGDGQTVVSNSPNITHTYNTFGNFIPKLILQDPSGCLIPVTGYDTIRIVGANAKFGIDDSLLCDAGFINLTDSTTFNDPVISYNWDFGDGGTSAQQNPTYYYTAPGLYTVTLAVQTQLGCVDTLRKDSLVKIVARPDISIIGDTEVCVFSPLQVNGSFVVPDTSIVTWNWNFGNGSSATGQNPSAQTYNASGNFVITAIGTNSSGCGDTATQTVRVHPLPTVVMPPDITIPAGTTITLPATYSGNMTSYLWDPSTFLSCTICPNPDATPNFNTRYNVEFTDSNGCRNTGSILVKVLCDNANVFIPNTFSPNADGSNDIFYPRGTGIDRAKVMRIFNRWGEVVFERYDFPANNSLYGWDGTWKGKKADAGVYIYQLEIYCQNGELLKFNGNIALIQ